MILMVSMRNNTNFLETRRALPRWNSTAGLSQD
jgi:hypothetical protein